MIADGKNDRLDEFMDEDDDHSMTEDDWVSYDNPEALASESEEEFVDSPQPARKKKSFSTTLLAKLLVGAVLLAGGGIAFLQMSQQGGGNQSQTPVLAAAEQKMTEQQTWSPQPAAPVAITDSAVPPMPATIEQDENAGPEEVAVTSAQRMEGAESQTPRMPKASDIMLKSVASESTEAPQSQQSPPAASAPAQDIAALSGKIDLLMTRLDKIEGNLDEVGALKDSMKNSIEDLEKKVAALSSRSEAASAGVRATQVKREEKQDAAPAAPAVATPAPAPVILSDSAIDVAPARAVPPKMPVENAAPNWILKGAQPDRAMVSKPGESDMRTVEVGSVLSGIGQITDISFQNGKWVVTGTRGRITQ